MKLPRFLEHLPNKEKSFQNTQSSPGSIPPVRRRRRFRVEQEQAPLDEAGLPGNSISSVAREHDIAPSQILQ